MGNGATAKEEQVEEPEDCLRTAWQAGTAGMAQRAEPARVNRATQAPERGGEGARAGTGKACG